MILALQELEQKIEALKTQLQTEIAAHQTPANAHLQMYQEFYLLGLHYVDYGIALEEEKRYAEAIQAFSEGVDALKKAQAPGERCEVSFSKLHKSASFLTHAHHSDMSAEQHVLLGMHYRYGIGLDVDYKSAHEHFSKAARMQHDTAQYELILMYQLNNGEILEEHFQWLQQANARGNKQAQIQLDIQIKKKLYSQLLSAKTNPESTKALDELQPNPFDPSFSDLYRRDFLYLDIKDALSMMKHCQRATDFHSCYNYTLSVHTNLEREDSPIYKLYQKNEKQFMIELNQDVFLNESTKLHLLSKLTEFSKRSTIELLAWANGTTFFPHESTQTPEGKEEQKQSRAECN